MNRLVVITSAVATLAAALLACGPDSGSAADTLPPIKTTSTTTTTTTTPDSRRKVYEVKPGDSLADIADKYCITVDSITEINDLEDGNYLEVGQMLYLPTDIVVVNCAAFTTVPSSSTDE